MFAHRVVPFVTLIGLLVIVGCDSGPTLVEVQGTVKANGKPLNKIQVEFWPVASGPRSMGTTDEQGHYSLLVDDGVRKGAIVGSHNVVLKDVGVLGDKFMGRKGEDVDMTKGKKSQIPLIYTDPLKTTIKKEVKSGPNVIDIDVTP